MITSTHASNITSKSLQYFATNGQTCTDNPTSAWEAEINSLKLARKHVNFNTAAHLGGTLTDCISQSHFKLLAQCPVSTFLCSGLSRCHMRSPDQEINPQHAATIHMVLFHTIIVRSQVVEYWILL